MLWIKRFMESNLLTSSLQEKKIRSIGCGRHCMASSRISSSVGTPTYPIGFYLLRYFRWIFYCHPPRVRGRSYLHRLLDEPNPVHYDSYGDAIQDDGSWTSSLLARVRDIVDIAGHLLFAAEVCHIYPGEIPDDRLQGY